MSPVDKICRKRLRSIRVYRRTVFERRHRRRHFDTTRTSADNCCRTSRVDNLCTEVHNLCISNTSV